MWRSRSVQIRVPQNKSNVKVDPVFMKPQVVIKDDYCGKGSHTH